MNRAYKHSGFTLIELLVVIAVIGLLATVVMSSLNSARGKARDAKRSTDLKSVGTALELYYDKYGYYPAWNQTAWGIDCSGFRGDSASSNTFLKPLVDEGFIKQYPQDPRGTNCMYQYRDEVSGQGYRLLFQYEAKTNNDLDCYAAGGWSCIRANYDATP